MDRTIAYIGHAPPFSEELTKSGCSKIIERKAGPDCMPPASMMERYPDIGTCRRARTRRLARMRCIWIGLLSSSKAA